MHCVLLALSLVTTTPKLLHVTVEGSIESSLSSLPAHEASVIGAQVARLLRWRGDVVKNVHRGDDLTLLYEPGDEQAELVAMHYRGSQIALYAYRFTGEDGIARYWDENGRLIEPTVSNPPVQAYVQITETVQRGRGKRTHAGIDFKAPTGTPVRLPFPGSITRVNWSRRANGNCIEVDIGGGRLMHFLHLSRIAAGVKSGVTLAAGAYLGDVGSTGHSNAPHLHYEILDARKRPLDPLQIHGTGSLTVAEASRTSFDAARAKYDGALGLEVAARSAVAGATAGAAGAGSTPPGPSARETMGPPAAATR